MGVEACKDPNEHQDDLAASAAEKIAAGSLLKLNEVAAALDVAPSTVHRLPLPSIRLGRSLRFDPRDVKKLIDESKEPFLEVSEA